MDLTLLKREYRKKDEAEATHWGVFANSSVRPGLGLAAEDDS
jgi:hypothetical protein